MRVTYTPKDKARDGGGGRWDIELGDIPSDAAELIEAHFDGTWMQFEVAVQRGGTLAKKLLLWHLMRTDHPGQHKNLKDVPNWTHRELVIEQGSAELRELRAAALKSGQFKTAEAREQFEIQVDGEIAEALARESKTVPAENTIDGTVVDPLPAAAAAIASPSSDLTESQSAEISSTSESATFGELTGLPSPSTE